MITTATTTTTTTKTMATTMTTTTMTHRLELLNCDVAVHFDTIVKAPLTLADRQPFSFPARNATVITANIRCEPVLHSEACVLTLCREDMIELFDALGSIRY